ncbi:MAG: hypothetical protein Q8P67_07280 [archaeon]|nr:hypothetical protein [archaeon]
MAISSVALYNQFMKNPVSVQLESLKETTEAQVAAAVKALQASQERRLLRQENKSAKRPGESFFQRLDSKLVKNAAFVKRVKLLSKDTVTALCGDLTKLNLSRYVSEIVRAVVDSTEKMRYTSEDLHSAVLFCSHASRLYPDFAETLGPQLIRAFAVDQSSGLSVFNSGAVAGGPSEPSGNTNPLSIFKRRRVILRLLADLQTVGILRESQHLPRLLQELIITDPYIGKNPSPDTSYSDATNYNLALVATFTRHVKYDLLGIAFSPLLDAGAEMFPETAERVAAVNKGFQDLLAAEGADPVVDPKVQQRLKAMISAYVSQYLRYLQTSFAKLRALERSSTKAMQTRGELSQMKIDQYLNRRNKFEKLRGFVFSLCYALQTELPVLIDEEPISEGPSILIQSSNDDSTPSSSLWGDEESRIFYDDLPKLKQILPDILFKTKKQRKALLDQATTTTTTTTSPAASKPAALPTAALPASPLPVGASSSSSTVISAPSSEPTQTLTHLLSTLSRCFSKELADQWAMDFIYINSKDNRQRLVKTLFIYGHSNPGLIPFYARIVTVLERGAELDDIAQPLLTLLDNEFKFFSHPNKKDQTSVEVKLRNVKYIGELTKFAICPLSLTLSYWHRLLQNFSLHCIEMMGCLLDTCGRYLYQHPESHAQANVLLEKMWRLKEVKSLSPALETVVENSYYLCKPSVSDARDTFAATRCVLTPLQQFAGHLLHHKLNAKNFQSVAHLLLKFPADHDEWILSSMLKLHNFRFSCLDGFAQLLGYMSRYSSIPIRFLDIYLYKLFRSLTATFPVWEDYQLFYTHLKFVGVLYTARLIELKVVYALLFILLNGSLEIQAAEPKESESDPAAVPPRQEEHLKWSNAEYSFRLRLICALLSAASSALGRTAELKRLLEGFVIRLQVLLLQKPFLSLDLEFMISDCFDSLPIKVTRHGSLAAARGALVDCALQPDCSFGICAPTEASALEGALAVVEESEWTNNEDVNNEVSNGETDLANGTFSQDEESSESDLSQSDGANDLSEAELSEEELEESDEMISSSDDSFSLLIMDSDRTPEDMAFDQMFDKMVHSSLEGRRPASHTAHSAGLPTIPLLAARPTRGTTPSSESEVVFTLLLRPNRSTKQPTVKAVNIPSSDPLVSNLMQLAAKDREERDRLKKFVLEYQRSET